MANITKKITRHIGGSQYWDTSTDLDDGAGAINAGDIFRIEDSLGKPGSTMSITTGAGTISIRINAMLTLYPARNSNEFFNSNYSNNISTGTETKDTSQTPIVIAASQTWEWNGEIPIRNIEIVSMAANFKLLVS
jgi:hypothetical protein